MNKGIVIVGFAGIGKTTLAKKYKYDIVLVWIHPEEILTDYDINDIDYYLYFPTKTAIKEYKKRFIERENNDNYIHHVLHHYNRRYKQFKDNPYKHIELIEGEPLETALLKMGINLIK